MRRSFALLRLITALLWLVASIAGLVFLPPVLNALGSGLDGHLEALTLSVERVAVSTGQTQAILIEVSGMLSTVSVTAVNASQALTETRPLLDETSLLITREVPQALQGVQSALPGVIETMEDIESTLNVLSNFSFAIPNLFGDDFEIGLGIQYQPETPVSQGLEEIDVSLGQVTPGLEALEDDLERAGENLNVLSEDLTSLGEDLQDVKDALDAVTPQLGDFATDLEDLVVLLRGVRETLPFRIRTLKIATVLGLSLLACTQLPVLYLGWERWRTAETRREEQVAEEEVQNDD